MPRGLQALALRATLLAISTRVISALVVGSQFEQTHTRKDSLWPDLALSDSDLEIREDKDCQHIENKTAQSYILLGPMDSGTHLIHQLMFNAWPSKVCMESDDFVWKHALTGVNDIYHYLLDNTDHDTLKKHVVLHTLRNPISLFASWRHKPYELRKCVSRDVADWHQPCIASMGPEHSETTSTQPTVYNSTMELYHQYLRQLKQLREAGWFKAVIPVHYEDMLLSPTETLTEIAKHFEGLDEIDKDLLEASLRHPAKPRAEGLDEELVKLAKKSYLQNFSTSDVKTMCNGLDRTLVEHYQARQVSYWEDCAHV